MALADRSGDPIGKDEAEAVLATRAELGPSYDVELVESFADRIEQVVQAQVAQHAGGLDQSHKLRVEAGRRQLTLGIVSLGTGIPITAISAGVAHESGLLIAWAGIALVNLAHALQSRRG